MHKPLSYLKGHVALPAWGPGSPVPLAWFGFPVAAALLGWRGWVGLVPRCWSCGWLRRAFSWVNYIFLMMNPQGEHYIHMHAVSGVWWRVPGGAGAGAAWVVESWPRAMARDLHGCGGSDRQESTR